MDVKNQKLEGVVQQEVSEGVFLVKLNNEIEIKVRLSSKQKLNYHKLQVGDLVFVERHPINQNIGYLLTQTDFKLNGWEGWTTKHSPKPISW